MTEQHTDLSAPAPPTFDPGNLLNSLPHAVLVIGEGNRILYVNAPAENFFDAGASLLLRRHLEDLVAFGSPLLALVEKIRMRGASFNEYGVDLGTPRIGMHRLVDVYARRLQDDPLQILIMLQQRTMAQMIERQLAHRGAARSVTGLAAVLAHEIKNPLSGVRGAAQLLETDLGDEDRALTQLICTETDRICKLVDRMEAFGETNTLERLPVNIHAVLEHVRGLAANGFAKQIAIREEYDPSLPPIPGDRDKLVQALLNLVKNAAEAIGKTRTDGEIRLATAFRAGVRLSAPGSKARISLPLEITVSDNGPGVPEDLQVHLFDPFVTSKAGGTGLGLALVAKIIGDHGGIIECDSTRGHTVFRILLPMQDPSQGQDLSYAPSASDLEELGNA